MQERLSGERAEEAEGPEAVKLLMLKAVLTVLDSLEYAWTVRNAEGSEISPEEMKIKLDLDQRRERVMELIFAEENK